MLVAGVAFITVVPIFMVHPPRWLKPRWLLELEAEIPLPNAEIGSF